MAFNPEIQETGLPNYTGASQGTGADKSFEALFSGLTDTFSNVTQIKDQNTQNAIRKDADAMFEQTNNEFNLTPEASPQGPSVFDLDVGQSTPSGLSSELDKISTLKAAVDQGKISEVNYYGRLATLSKQLRSRYPRYEEIVDKTIQEVTGTRPANAYRDALFSEINSLSSEASAEKKSRQNWINQNQDVISLVYGDDFFKNPDQYDFDEVQAKVAKEGARKYGIDAKIQQLGLESKTNEVNQVAAAKTISQDFGFIVESTTNRAIGANSPSFNQTLNTFAAGGQTPEQLDALQQNLTLVESQTRTALIARANAIYAGKVPQEEINKQIEAAMYPITAAKEAILGKDYKAAARYATVNKSINDRNLNELLNNSPEFAAAVAMREASQTAADVFLNEQGITAIGNVAMTITGRNLMGDKEIIKNTIDTGDSQVSRKVIDNQLNVLKSPNVTGEKLSNVVDGMFGTGAPDWFKEVQVSDREALFVRFLDPAITAAIVARGTPQDLETYSEWALDTFTSIPSLRAAAGEMNQTFMDELELRYDPANHRLKIIGDPGLINGQYSVARPMVMAVNSLNRAFSVLDPILEAKGDDADQMMQGLIQNMNIEMEGSSQKGFFRRVLDSMRSGSDDVGGSGGSDELPGSLENIDDGQIDFIDQNNGFSSMDGGDQGDLSSSFVDPKSNPSVSPQVLAKFGNKRLPASIRLNNMGAVSIVGDINNSFAAKQPGFVGAVPRPKNEGGYYAQYATPEHGVAAASKLLERYGKQGVNTPVEITKKWAASPGNYPNVLVKYLREAGFDVDRNTPVNLNDPAVRIAILKAKSAHESGAGRPAYSDDVFDRGVNMT